MLVDELGVEPGPGLQLLHQKILAGDPAFSAPAREHDLPPAAGGTPAPVAVPRQLPAAAGHFTGRRAEVAELTAVLDPARADGAATAVAVIDGPPGAGKTALAVHWAHRAAAGFPDGQLFVNLRGFDPAGSPVSPTDALRGFLEALGVAPERLPRSEEGLAGLYRSLLASQRVLVVLDNARDAAQARPLLPGSGRCRVIVTSRSQLTGLVAVDDAARVTVTVMNRAEARQLLTARLGAQRAAEDEQAVERIADSCGGLPLALCITAARATMRPSLPLAQIAADLAGARGSLAGLAVPGDLAADVGAAFSWSYDALAPANARMFRLLGLHPGPEFSAEAAASLAGVPRDTAARLLADLTQSSLLSAARARFTLHDLIRDYAAALADADDSEADRRAAVRRMLDHYLTTAATAARLVDQTPLATEPPAAASGVLAEELGTRAQALGWLDREYPVLLRLIDQAAAAGFDVHAWQLPRALRNLFEWRARWQDWDHAHRIAAEAAARLGDLRAQALTELAWAKCQIEQDRWPQAEQHLHRALQLFGKLNDLPGRARVLVNLAVATSTAGNYQQATGWAQRAHALYTDLEDLDGQAGSLANLGLYQVRLGAFAIGGDMLSRARDMFTALGNRGGQAVAAANLGLACHALGDYQQAITCHQAAADLLAELGDLAGQAEVLSNLANAYRADGQHDQAIRACQQALAIHTELHHPDTAKTRAQLTELQAR